MPTKVISAGIIVGVLTVLITAGMMWLSDLSKRETMWICAFLGGMFLLTGVVGLKTVRDRPEYRPGFLYILAWGCALILATIARYYLP